MQNGVEFLQAYTFVIKHKVSTQNQVTDILSRVCLLISSMEVSVIWFEVIKELYKEDLISLRFGVSALKALLKSSSYKISSFPRIIIMYSPLFFVESNH